jgi:TPR repeat protein
MHRGDTSTTVLSDQARFTQGLAYLEERKNNPGEHERLLREAIECFAPLANKYPNAKQLLGKCYNRVGICQYNNKDYSGAAISFHKAEELGNSEHPIYLATLYHHGEGVNQYYHMAALYYNKGAEHNNPSCLYGLGLLYEYGNGVPKDEIHGLTLQRKAAELGDYQTQE